MRLHFPKIWTGKLFMVVPASHMTEGNNMPPKFRKLYPCRCEVCQSDFNADDKEVFQFHEMRAVLCHLHRIERWFSELTNMELGSSIPEQQERQSLQAKNRLRGIIW